MCTQVYYSYSNFVQVWGAVGTHLCCIVAVNKKLSFRFRSTIVERAFSSKKQSGNDRTF